MEKNQNPESMKDLFSKVQQQLNLTLQSRDARVAQQAIGTAEKVMAKIEALILADPMLNDEQLYRVVEFTRGSIWEQARRHAAVLQKAQASLGATI